MFGACCWDGLLCSRSWRASGSVHKDHFEVKPWQRLDERYWDEAIDWSEGCIEASETWGGRNFFKLYGSFEDWATEEQKAARAQALEARK